MAEGWSNARDDNVINVTMPRLSKPRITKPGLANVSSLISPLLLVCIVVVGFSHAGASVEQEVQYALADLVIVVGLQAFVGTSGVLSFGHVGFVAIGAWTVGLLLEEPATKKNTIPTMFSFLQDVHSGFWLALVLAMLLGGALAAAVAPILMRLHGLQAGIATFAFLNVIDVLLASWNKIGPASSQQGFFFSSYSLGILPLLLVALSAVTVSWLYQRSRSARLLRASRESLLAAPASGINVTRHRIIALVVSGLICGVGGGLTAQVHGSIDPSQVSVQLTFVTISMLVLGGLLSLWGAVVGTVIFSGIDFLLQQVSSGVNVAGVTVTIPAGAHQVVLGAVLVLVLLLRPAGITSGEEVGWPILGQRLGWLRRAALPRINTASGLPEKVRDDST